MKCFYIDYLRQNNLNILISNIIIIFVFILFRNTLIEFLNLLPHFCLFDRLFNIQCPVCGMTRGLCELSKGNVNKAVSLNSACLLMGTFFILQIPLRLYSLFFINSTEKVNRISKLLSNSILFIILILWFLKLFLI